MNQVKIQKKVIIPKVGEKISIDHNGKLLVPDNPIIPFIEGDGTGKDIWNAAQRVLDYSVFKAYNGSKKIAWMEVYVGEKSNQVYGENT